MTLKNSMILLTAIVVLSLIFVQWLTHKNKLISGMEVPSTTDLFLERCDKHQALVTDCIYCYPELREYGRLWCEEHDRYEDRCFICHPESKEANRLWCEEHKLYEDECFFCHPELGKAGKKSTDEEGTFFKKSEGQTTVFEDIQCVEHGVPENECGICHPDLLGTLQPGQGLKIRLESHASAEKAGILTATPTPGNSRAGFVVLSRTAYNQNQLARITPFVSGIIYRVLVDAGDAVSKGQVLVEIISPEITGAKNEYLSALANEALNETLFKREKGLVEKKISSQQEYEHALAAYHIAKNTTAMIRQRLMNYGLTTEQLPDPAGSGSISSIFQILAPFSGTLLDRSAVVGEAVEPGDILFSLADLSSMWLELSVPEDGLFRIQLGDSVEATFDALPEVTVQGRVIWLASGIDEFSRMMKARAIVPNPGASLKQGMFGEVRILPKQDQQILYVAAEALQRFDGKSYVFIKKSVDLFEIRNITLGGKDPEYIEILKGISPDEEVVVTHSFTLKSEFLKSRLGAGCVDE